MADYKAKTKDGEVSTLEEVLVGKSYKVDKIDVVSLGELNAQKARILEQITTLQQNLIDVEAEIAVVEVVAKTIILKTVEVEL